jgi:hypothetical protein
MQTTFFKILGATLIAATTVQMAGAAERHARKAHATATQQFRNSNAYAAPGVNAYAAPDVTAPRPSYLSNLAEGAQASGPAGR